VRVRPLAASAEAVNGVRRRVDGEEMVPVPAFLRLSEDESDAEDVVAESGKREEIFDVPAVDPGVLVFPALNTDAGREVVLLVLIRRLRGEFGVVTLPAHVPGPLPAPIRDLTAVEEECDDRVVDFDGIRDDVPSVAACVMGVESKSLVLLDIDKCRRCVVCVCSSPITLEDAFDPSDGCAELDADSGGVNFGTTAASMEDDAGESSGEGSMPSSHDSGMDEEESEL